MIARVLTLCAVVVATAGVAQATPYQDAVTALNPTYYYHLDETTTAGGAVDSIGNAAPGVYQGTYGVGGPDVGFAGPLVVNGGVAVPGVGGASNVSHNSNNAGQIDLGAAAGFGANAMTVAMFIQAGPSQGGDRLFTNNLSDATQSFQLTVGQSEGLVVGINPNASGAGAARTLFVPDNSGRDLGFNQAQTGWWHVVASTSGATAAERYANIQVWINGVDRTSNMLASSGGWGVENTGARIGGRSPGVSANTHSGAQDEVSIWLDRVLTQSEVTRIWNSATGVPEPASVALMAIAGCTGLVVLRRRRRA